MNFSGFITKAVSVIARCVSIPSHCAPHHPHPLHNPAECHSSRSFKQKLLLRGAVLNLWVRLRLGVKHPFHRSTETARKHRHFHYDS